MPEDAKSTPRWVYRFDNYKRAFSLLREAVESMEERELGQLEKEGVIQRFEYTWELSWKVLKDYLEASGVDLATVTPVSVVRAALSAKLIDDGETWMRALDARNKMSHTYDLRVFDKIIVQIRDEFLTLFDHLHVSFLQKMGERDADG